jgi:signal transduction histidine kinase
MEEPFQLNLLRALADVQARLRDVGLARKALVFGLKKAKEVFGAPEAALATLKPDHSSADLIFTIPEETVWDTEMLARYLREERPPIPWTVILAPVRRRRRNWAVIALRNSRQEFSKEQRDALFLMTQLLTESTRVLDERRVREVRRKIVSKIANRQDPKDLMYDILHGLRSLTHYDHSASLFIAKNESDPLELAAEQIAWTKARSRRIGMRVDLDDDLRRQIQAEKVQIYIRDGGAWKHATESDDPLLPRVLSYTGDVPPEVAMVCAPIATPDGTLGVLKISSRREGVLDSYEVGLVEEFMPLASMAIQFSVRTESLRRRMVQSERKHALANLTRGITHDVNNALGATLPLVQQLREDAESGRLELSILNEDLHHIEESIQTCRRIFSGMLLVARGGSRSAGHGNLRRAIDGALSVLEDSMRRKSIRVKLDVPSELPTIRGGQGDLTQLFLNIFTNARDAMTDGGELRVSVELNHDLVHVSVEDTGCGVPPDKIQKIAEPFYTTKADGNGLGLSVCRSVLYDIGGEMRMESKVGEGTRVSLTLPVLKVGGQDS